MAFTGFSDDQFSVFERAGFSERMTGIRSLIRPGLLALGEVLAPLLSARAGHPLYPHVALHARRRVNPPDDTWVAFSRASRGYKAYAHFEVGISAESLFFGLVLKDESSDRGILGRKIIENPEEMMKIAARLKGYIIDELPGVAANHATLEQYEKLANALVKRKTSTFHCCRTLAGADRRAADPSAVIKLAQDYIKPLLPLYAWATTVSE